MDSFFAERHLVSQLSQGKRIGQPVAVRYHLKCDRAGVRDPEWLARAVQIVCHWLGWQPARVWARPTLNGEHVSLHVIASCGESLLLSLGTGEGRPTSDLVVVGNRGIASYVSAEYGAGHAIDERALSEVYVDDKFVAQLASSLARSTPSRHPLPAIAPPRNSFSPVQTPLGVLLVTGNHSHQENYARALADDPRCRLIGLTDDGDLSPRRWELNAQLAQELSIPVFDDFEAAIRRDDVQIISICAAPERRARLIERAAAAGKHLYLDKPLSAGLVESRAIVEAVAQAGVNQQMFSLVHTNFARRVRELVQSGDLGELQAVHCDAFFAKGMPGSADLTQVRRETARPTNFETIEAKRELHNVGVYSLVLLRWLLGVEPVRLFANTSNYFFREHQERDMEDYAHVTVEFMGGMVATIATGRTGWRSHPAGGMNRVVVVGSKRSAAVDWYTPRLEVWADEEPWTLPRRHPEDPMGFWTSTSTAAGAKAKQTWLTPAEATNDARYFVDCVVNGQPSDVTAADGAAVMEQLIAAYESSATGEPVNFPLVI